MEESSPGRSVIVAFPKTGASWLALSLHALEVDIIAVHAGNGHGQKQGFQPLTSLQIDQAPRMVALFRDPRDTVISGYWQCHVRVRQFGGSLRDFILHPWHGMEKQVAFDFALMDLCQRIPSRSVTYQSLHADGVHVIRGLAGFLERPTSAERARVVLAACQIDRLRALELAGAFGRRDKNQQPIQPKPGQPNSLRFRRGIVGSHLDEMSPEDVALCDEILARHDYFARLDQHLKASAG